MASSAKQRRKQLLKAQKLRAKRRVVREVEPSPTARVRMSEVISHLAEPIVEALSGSVDDLERIITLTIAAWNLTLFGADVRNHQFQKVSQRFFGQDHESIAMFRWMCDVVAERKSLYYPHVNNVIFDVHFTRESKDTVYFEVAYNIIPDTTRQP